MLLQRSPTPSASMLSLIIFLITDQSEGQWKPENLKLETFAMVSSQQLSSCNKGSILLYCGIDDSGMYRELRKDNESEAYSKLQVRQIDQKTKYAHPFNKTTCACFDLSVNNQMQESLFNSSGLHSRFYPTGCVAWCYRTEETSKYSSSAASETLYKNMLVSCPTGTKVAGCHMQFGVDVLSSKHVYVGRFYYPTYDGESCFCRDTIGSKCIATCVADVKGYDIKVVKGHNSIFVEAVCPLDSVVLGCGIQPEFNSLDEEKVFEKYPSTFVADAHTCVCYSRYNDVRCYAVCAKELH